LLLPFATHPCWRKKWRTAVTAPGLLCASGSCRVHAGAVQISFGWRALRAHCLPFVLNEIFGGSYRACRVDGCAYYRLSAALPLLPFNVLCMAALRQNVTCGSYMRNSLYPSRVATCCQRIGKLPVLRFAGCLCCLAAGSRLPGIAIFLMGTIVGDAISSSLQCIRNWTRNYLSRLAEQATNVVADGMVLVRDGSG